MRIFATGATGFVGRSLIPLLEAAGHEVLSLQRSLNLNNAHALKGDLSELASDPKPLQNALQSFQPHVVIHLAWGKASNLYRDHACHYLENLRFTERLVDIVADDLPRTHFIGVGSQAEYGPLNTLLTPATAAHPRLAYGKAKKLAGEYALARLADRAAWLRLLTAYGPGDDPNKFIPYVLKCYRDGQAPVTSPGAQVWDWLHVSDAALALSTCAEQRVSGLHVLASGETASFRDVTLQLQTLARARGLNALDPQFGGRPYATNELYYLAGDPASLMRACGWRPGLPLAIGLTTLF